MQGLHLTADLYNCQCESAWLSDAQRLQDWCVQAVPSAGLQSDGAVFRNWRATAGDASGVSAAMLMGASHLCLHTSTEQRSVTADVFVGDDGEQAQKARALMDALVGRFQPEWTEQRSLDRGSGDE